MKKIISILVVSILCFTNIYAQWTPETVPDPKKTGTGYVSNPDEIITNQQVTVLDSSLANIEDSAKVQVAIVVLKSIGETVPKDFAVKLFNLWGVGNAEADNGLLILFVLDQRRIEFETGYGVEHILTDAICYKIQQDNMISFFKEGNYGEGIVSGVLKIEEILLTPAVTEEYSDIDNSSNYNNNYKTNSEEGSFLAVITMYLLLLIFPVGLYSILLGISYLHKDYYQRYKILRIFLVWIWMFIYPIPFVPFYFLTKFLTTRWRDTPRVSSRTGKIMHKLSEEEEDRYLNRGQIAEEHVKSVDYDVWVSDANGDVLIQSYKRWFSGYNKCPKCKYKTYKKVYDRVIQSATYSSSGYGERKYECSNCNHQVIKTYTIPRKTKTSTTSSSSSSSSSSSWGGSSSWSGSSSWGGGSSGGGGSGSSW